MPKTLLTIGVLSVSVMIATVGASPSVAADAPAKSESTTFIPAAGQSLAAVEKAIMSSGASLDEARYTFRAAGQVLTVGVPGNGTLSDDAGVVADTLNDLEAKTAESAANNPDLVKGDLTPQLIAAARGVISNGFPAPAEVSLSGNLSSVATSSLVRKVAPAIIGPSASSAGQTAAACGSTWWPSYVNGLAGPASSGGRSHLFYVRFSLTTLQAFKCLGSTAFEPDFVTYNYDNAYYFANSMLSWSSTMPSPYWDTNAFDASSERVYTVGSQNINGFISGTQYSVYFRMNNGNAGSDTAKIVWQRSHYQDACILGPAWCIFADASKIQYAWIITVPGRWAP